MTGTKKKVDDNLKKLRELASLYNNKRCFECNQKGPTYVNMTLGAFVCTKCSGLLRGLNPPHRVKSISMATFTPVEIEFLEERGNMYCQRIWLGLFDPKSHQDIIGDGNNAAVRDELKMKDFLIDKYEKKIWYVTPQEVAQQPLSRTSGINLSPYKTSLLAPMSHTHHKDRTGKRATSPKTSANNTTIANSKKEKSDSFSSAKSSGDSSYSSALAMNNGHVQPGLIATQNGDPFDSNPSNEGFSFVEDFRKSPNLSAFPGNCRQHYSSFEVGGTASPTNNSGSLHHTTTTSSSNNNSLVRRRSGNITHSLSSSPKILNGPFAIKPPAPNNKKKLSTDSISSINVEAYPAADLSEQKANLGLLYGNKNGQQLHLNGHTITSISSNESHRSEQHPQQQHKPYNNSVTNHNDAFSAPFVQNGFEDSFSSLSSPPTFPQPSLNLDPNHDSNLNNTSQFSASSFVMNNNNLPPLIPSSILPEGATGHQTQAKSTYASNCGNSAQLEDKYSALAELDNAYHNNAAAQNCITAPLCHPNPAKSLLDESKNPFTSPPNGISLDQQHKLAPLTHKFGNEFTLSNLTHNGATNQAGWVNVDGPTNPTITPKPFYQQNGTSLCPTTDPSYSNNAVLRTTTPYLRRIVVENGPFQPMFPDASSMVGHKQTPNPFIPPQLPAINMNISSIVTNPFL